MGRTIDSDIATHNQLDPNLVLAYELCRQVVKRMPDSTSNDFYAAAMSFQEYLSAANYVKSGHLTSESAQLYLTEVLKDMYALKLIPPENMPVSLISDTDDAATIRMNVVFDILDKIAGNCPTIVDKWATYTAIEKQLIIEALYQDRVNWRDMSRIRMLRDLYPAGKTIRADRYPSGWSLLSILGIHFEYNEIQKYNRNKPDKPVPFRPVQRHSHAIILEESGDNGGRTSID